MVVLFNLTCKNGKLTCNDTACGFEVTECSLQLWVNLMSDYINHVYMYLYFKITAQDCKKARSSFTVNNEKATNSILLSLYIHKLFT